jgi:hypothetical protein
MFDPFFGIALIGGPIAIAYLFVDARLNVSSVPSVATCLVALFAAYSVFEWVMTIGLVFLGQSLNHTRALNVSAAIVATVGVGLPFALSARARRNRAGS